MAGIGYASEYPASPGTADYAPCKHKPKMFWLLKSHGIDPGIGEIGLVCEVCGERWMFELSFTPANEPSP